MKTLNEQTAIVTGGGTGIGRGVALALAREGAKVVICGRRVTPLESTSQEIADMGGACHYVQADMSKPEDVERLVKTALDIQGTIDILINNAGIDGEGYIHEHDLDTWDRVMAINLRGPFLLARAVLPTMRAQHGGQIVMISSEGGLEYYNGLGGYAVAKSALNFLAELIQRENQELGIRVHTVCPGVVVTELHQERPDLIPENSLYPEDIADLVIWLLTRRPNIKFGRPILIQTMKNPWKQNPWR